MRNLQKWSVPALTPSSSHDPEPEDLVCKALKSGSDKRYLAANVESLSQAARFEPNSRASTPQTCRLTVKRASLLLGKLLNNFRHEEFDGSDSGARPDEAVSWGKIRMDATPVKASKGWAIQKLL